ncbi:MAG TPA: sigma-54 dependent transcriptional regulator [Thermoanaerobaculia bacterium]|nr:sigma-54 dependent transcriptional regulator [Thermoanaerobaculia bacterium]
MPSSGARAFRRAYPTRSESLRALVDVVAKVVEHNAGLLIIGESGSGKDHLAELVHACGPRRGASFVRIDCASIPPELFESELFGYEKGAFTDARTRKIGKLDLAQKGTLYLDGVAGLANTLQAKLLRVIQEKQFSRLGGNYMLDLDARIISSASESPELLVNRGQLRSDLYYRLNVVSVELPPLRERKDDIPMLAEEFLGERGTALGRKFEGFDPEAMDLMLAYSWPGNVRELRNVVDRAALLEEGTTVSPNSLPHERFLQPSDFLQSANERAWSLEELEKQYIREVLRRTGSNYSASATILGINRKTLLEKRRKYDLG